MTKSLPFRVLPAYLVPLFLSVTVMATTAAEATQATRPPARPELRVGLKYVPTDAEEVLEERGVMAIAGPPFEILAVVDDRPEPRELIGQSIDRKKVPIPVRAKQPVAPWLHQVLESSFAEWGTPGKPGADLLLEPVVIKFFVVEENTYQAEVTMKFLLRRRDGTELWAGVVGGAASRFGRWLNESNYQEVISDAVLACYSKLWADPGFREAWAGKPASRDVTAASTAARPAATETLEPQVAMKKLLDLKAAGFGDDSLVAWVRKISFTRPLTADDMITWKSAGVPEAAIRVAIASE